MKVRLDISSLIRGNPAKVKLFQIFIYGMDIPRIERGDGSRMDSSIDIRVFLTGGEEDVRRFRSLHGAFA
jgi:hypothetical protein